jgi:DNA ligase (NAD+)
MKIEIPTECPSCSSPLELVNSQLFCRNNDCPAQSSKKLETYAKTMKIKGLGPAAIKKLEIVSIPELYELTESSLVEKLGDKIGKKIHCEIDKSKICEFSTFLSALSIPLIGKTASKKIANAGINSLKDISPLQSWHGIIGAIAGDNLHTWLNACGDEFFGLPIKFVEYVAPTKTLGKVCITGKLNDFPNRTEASKHLEKFGYTVTTTVSKQTNYLVDEAGGNSSKRTKAEQLEIEIVTIKQLEELINE